MKEGKYTKTLAKIQVGEIFTCEISAEILICIIHRACGDTMFVPLWVAPTWRQIHLLPSFATNAWIHHSRNSWTLKFSFLIQLLTLDSKILKKNLFLTYMTTLSVPYHN